MGPFFDLEILEFTDTVESGTEVGVTLLVTNTGERSGTGTVSFAADEFQETSSTEVSLDPGDSTEETLTLSVPIGVTGVVTTTLHTDDVSLSEPVEIIELGGEGNGDDDPDDTPETDDEDDAFRDEAADEDAADDEPSQLDDDGPGLGVISALSGLGGTAYVLKRRLGDDQD